MDLLLYCIVSLVIGTLRRLSLLTVARIGRAGGWLFYYIDRRHRRSALRNLALSFPEKSPAEITALAFENFKRIGENFACAVKTAYMPMSELESYCEIVGVEKIAGARPNAGTDNRVVALGHFGNFELLAKLASMMPGYQGVATYRGVKQPRLNKLLQNLRAQSQCRFYERRSEALALRAAMNKGRTVLGLLVDQNAGRNGLWLPFLGRECSTTPAPAILALRYNAPLFNAICYRLRPAYWRIEVGDEIPTLINGEPRSIEAITTDVNRGFEEAVRRDPANWFWVHNRWKPKPASRPPSVNSLMAEAA